MEAISETRKFQAAPNPTEPSIAAGYTLLRQDKEELAHRLSLRVSLCVGSSVSMQRIGRASGSAIGSVDPRDMYCLELGSRITGGASGSRAFVRWLSLTGCARQVMSKIESLKTWELCREFPRLRRRH